QTKLKRLTESQFLHRLFLPRQNQHGSAPSIYTLARKGLNYLDAQGLDVNVRYHPSEQEKRSYLFLSHTQALNDVLITLELFCRQRQEVVLHTMQHERTLRRDPVYVQDHEGRRLAVIPDAWLDLHFNGSEHMCLALEVDRGSEEQKKWRQKIRGIVAWVKGPYQEKFQTDTLTVAVIATPGMNRLEELLRWTEAELGSLSEQRQADLFRFTGQDVTPEDPSALFLSPNWYRPFDAQAVPLLDGLGPN
ncbi:MAG: hypothetical protein EPO21_22110, partial [Chloroflexota bacterium]